MNGNTGKSSKSGARVIRLPRPYGATTLAVAASKAENPSGKEAFVQFMIQQWLLGNGDICGRTYDIQTLAQSLHITTDVIRVRMRDQVMNSRIWDKDQQTEILYGVMGQMLSWSMEDRMRVNNQIGLLTRSQGGQYKPFVSAELNKALKLGVETSNSLQNMFQKIMGGGGTTNIFTFNQQNNDNSVNTYVTRDQVLEILSTSDKQLPKEEQAKLLESKYDLASLPEVVATKQEGIDTSKEGLGGKINVQQMNQITDNLKAAMEVADNDHHEMRRQIEMGIDPDDEDPELDTYEELPQIPKEEFSVANFLND